MKKLFFAIILTCAITFFSTDAFAAELKAKYTFSDGSLDNGALSDTNYNTAKTFSKGNTITITADDGSKISGLYIIWNSPVTPWTLTADGKDIKCGENKFLHEYVALETASTTLTITIPANKMSISRIRIFSEGELPKDVQVWTPPCERADIMIISSHADDEILFFGGILPTYGSERNATIQVVYMTEFWTTAPIREHEKLDGLWTSGINIYPTCLDLYDMYSSNLAQAENQYNLELITEMLTEQIRRFKPQVIVTHDFNGEYGHGFHMFTAKATTMAIEDATNADKYPTQVSTYGLWDTPKTYIHLYGENKIKLDLRKPLVSMNNQTALDIAKAAYKQHVSQQWCWFYVSDEYEYSCAEFGLYRTKVGLDTDNDILCNIKTYAVQKAEEESIQASISQSVSQSESESISRYEEESASIEASIKAASEAASREAAKNTDGKKSIDTITIVLGILLVIAIFVLLESWYLRIKRKRNK